MSADEIRESIEDQIDDPFRRLRGERVIGSESKTPRNRNFRASLFSRADSLLLPRYRAGSICGSTLLDG